ncbi:MAG: adenylate/guanylate cyclase domain-containing protein [Spirochaetaceae bacterium]|nr:adenylate/guanylate cyclase domain-containing protein [Spirochaetaceae bacterium]
MKKSEKKVNQQKIIFPIGAKLIGVISAIVLGSLGVITALIWLMVRQDIEQTTIQNNVEINAINTHLTEQFISLMRNKAVFRLDTANNKDAETDELFFGRNNDIAAIIETNGKNRCLINEQFFNDNRIDLSLLDAFLEKHSYSDTYLVNAAPEFYFPLLAIYDNHIVILVSTEKITEAFFGGAVQSFMTNTDGNILIYPNDDLVQGGDNILSDNVFNSADYFLCEHSVNKSNGDAIATIVTFIPIDVVFEGINASTRRNCYLALVVWLTGVLFAWFFSKALSYPLVQLSSAVRKIEDGEYHIHLENNRNDETGMLTASVLRMSHILGNFEKLTNKTIARLARTGILKPGGEIKNATVFFSDIRAFTAISETMKPSDIVEFLNDYMDRMVACIILTGGTIDKFIGDAIMAHRGAIDSDKTDEHNALAGVRAALMMRAALASFNKDRGTEKKPVIKIGCALDSGAVVAGQIGSAERIEFTVIGNTVSLADRTETFNKPFGTEILITEHTYNLAGEHFITHEMPRLIDGGKEVRVFAVINMKDEKEQLNILSDLEKIPKTEKDISAKFVGPEGPKTLAELRALLDIAEPNLRNVNTGEEEKKYKIKKPSTKQKNQIIKRKRVE